MDFRCFRGLPPQWTLPVDNRRGKPRGFLTETVSNGVDKFVGNLASR